ncbi:hypothetical protein [Fibrella forsythiae]|uniref:DUF2335 domain-containing protein n=1 Tax=Fibrella forsythiae TaxID=2817061 RepID=A0ABS3JHE9_9BACT|nr:hypothetical protein [Fibrella forsythiae]MBO0948838.1 hypothetical protein [Fibrella forsythiae]
MKTLTPAQVDQLRTHLYKSGATPSQASSLLPLFSQEVEHFMWIGLPFEVALDKVELEAEHNPVRYLREKHANALVMPEEQLNELDLDEIVFANRNRAYGAYDLRKAYNRAVVNALLMTLGLVLMILAAMEAYQQGKWVYASWGGGAWIAGIFLVAFSAFRFYVERITLVMTENR